MSIEPQNKQQDGELVSQENTADRRELIQKLGKFAVYAAPFTVLAGNAKALSSSGPNSAPRH